MFVAQRNTVLEEPANSFPPVQVCAKCVMDTTEKTTIFDDSGVCNHCQAYADNLAHRVAGEEGKERLDKIVTKIKQAGKGKAYDCIIGVSGGVDSTYVAYRAKEMGLRPLAVHFDNGWNSELAVHNIEQVLNKLDIDLLTYVVDWEEFKDLQLSFLKASVPDGEIPTDHAILATLIDTAISHNVNYVITGLNYITEGISFESWSYGHHDWRYISDIQSRFGSTKLKSTPHFTLFRLFYALAIKRIKFVSLLNYIDYNREQSVRILNEKLGWRHYGGKHYESVYTRFFQGFILPHKFKIDKRKAYLTSQIVSSNGEYTREMALEELKANPYPQELFQKDKEFVCKKFGLSNHDFDKIMSETPRSFNEYKTNYGLVKKARAFYQLLRTMGFIYK